MRARTLAGSTAASPVATNGFNTRSFALVAGTERRRIARGRPTPQSKDFATG